LTYLNEVTISLDAGIPFDVILVDFRRAFDMVPFTHMLIKLEAHGIVGQLLTWFKDWMSDRKQRVVINGSSSDWTDVISSVVQGSVIGPILFLIFINDIDCIMHEDTKLYKFADDSKFGRRIRTPTDAAILQADLDGIVLWAKRNGMCLHPEKTTVMHFGHNNPRHQYTIDGAVITTSDCSKDLGVDINIKCTPRDHVTAVAKKANCVLGQLRRVTVCRSKEMVMKTYKIYVRPILESAVQVWSPWLSCDIEHLEKVQRRATKLVSGIGSKTYDERLTICNLTSLEQRRERADVTECFKILNGFTDMEQHEFFECITERHDINTRGATGGLLVPEKSKLDIRKFFFNNRVTKSWNDLPLELRTASSINCFKNLYDLYHLPANLSNI